LLVKLETQTTIQEERWALVGSEFVLKPDNVLDVMDDGVQIDTPLHKLPVARLIIDQVAGNEVGNAGIFEVLLDNIHCSLASFALYIQTLDLLNGIDGLLNLLLIPNKALRGCVYADQSRNAIRVQASEGHCSFGTDVMT
jgi:hypothetical protein